MALAVTVGWDGAPGEEILTRALPLAVDLTPSSNAYKVDKCVSIGVYMRSKKRAGDVSANSGKTNDEKKSGRRRAMFKTHNARQEGGGETQRTMSGGCTERTRKEADHS